MNKKQIIRTLAAHAADAVVLLEKIWPDDAFPAKLCDRVDASDYFITNRGAVIASDLRVPFLAEQVGAVGISSADVHTRWKIVVIYQPDIRLTYAVRTTAWDKKPRFPGLDLSDREVDLVYEMCDTLSRNRAYVEKDFSTETALFSDILSNTQAVKSLGAFDESRFIELLQNDPLALPVLEAVLLAGVWSNSTLEHVPNFLMVFALPNAQALSVRENLEEHFHTVDLLRSPSAPFERPLTLRLENSQPPVYSPAASGRLVLLEPIGDAPRKLLIARSNSIRAFGCLPATPRHARLPRSPSSSPRVPFRRRMRTPSLCPNRHTLCASPTQTAFAWRLPSYCAAFLEQQARSTRPLMILPAIHTPTG